MAVAKVRKSAMKSVKAASGINKQNTAQSRLNVRLSSAIKDRVVRAAALSGQDITEFAVSTLSEKASLVIEQHDNLVLSNEDHEFFLKALNEPTVSEPSERSLSAAEKYRSGIRKGVRFTLAG